MSLLSVLQVRAQLIPFEAACKSTFQTFFVDYVGELKRVVNNIRERHSKILGTEDWELFRQTIRILEICGTYSRSE